MLARPFIEVLTWRDGSAPSRIRSFISSPSRCRTTGDLASSSRRRWSLRSRWRSSNLDVECASPR